MGREYSLLSFDRYQRIETSIVKKGEYSMKIRKKLLAMLLGLSLLLNMAPMAAFATSVSAPGDVKLTLTDDNYVQVTWSRPDPVTEYPIFDFEVTLYYDGVQVGQKSDLRYSPATFKEIPSSDIERYGVEVSSLRIKKQGEVKNFCRSHPAGPRRIGLAQSSGKSTLPTKE